MGSVALLGIAIALAILDRVTATGGGGKPLLTYTAGAAYLYCLMTGFSLTLASIREERDQGTLGLLFLTPLGGGQIVLAKLFARSLRAFEGLIATLPVFALCVLLGGVTMAEFGRVGLALLNTLFVSACLGMFLSTKRLQTAAVAFLGGTLILSLGVIAPVLGGILASDYDLPSLAFVVAGVSPLFPLACSQAKLHALGFYGASLGASFLTGVFFLALAIRSVRGNWQDRQNQTKKQRRLKEFQNWDFRSGSRDPKYRAALLDRNPVCWLNCRDRYRSIGYWIYFAVVYGALFLCWRLLDRHGTPLGFWWLAAIVFDLGMRAKLNQAAGIQLVEERKLGSLEMILCAPVGLKRILAGLWMALRRQFGPVLLAVTALNLVLMGGLMALHTRDRYERVAEPATIFWIVACYTIINLSNWIALAWVGTWFGLRNKPDAALASFGMGRVMLRPWLFVGLIALTMLLLEFAGVEVWRWVTGAGWFGLGIAAVVLSDALYVRRARAEIPRAFQLAATGVLDQPLEPPRPPEPEDRSALRSLLDRLWRRKWLRWCTPLALAVLFVTGNRAWLGVKFERRLAQLRAEGVPSSRADLALETEAKRAEGATTALVESYRALAANRIYRHKELWRGFDRLRSPQAEDRKFREDDLEHLRAFVLTNRPAMNVFRQALTSGPPDFEVDHWNHESWPHYANLRAVVENMHCEVLLAVHEGRVEEALEWSRLSLEHTRLLEDADHARYIYHRQQQCRNLRDLTSLLLSSGLASRLQLSALQSQIGAILERTPGFISRQVDLWRAYLIEELTSGDRNRQFEAAMVYQQWSRVPPPARAGWELNALLGGMERARLGYLDALGQAQRIVSGTRPGGILEFRQIEGKGRPFSLGADAAPFAESLAMISYRQVFWSRLCLTAIAAERYRLDHEGALPSTVEELYPLYLKTIPVNPVDGRPLLIEARPRGFCVTAESESPLLYEGVYAHISNEELLVER